MPLREGRLRHPNGRILRDPVSQEGKTVFEHRFRVRTPFQRGHLQSSSTPFRRTSTGTTSFISPSSFGWNRQRLNHRITDFVYCFIISCHGTHFKMFGWQGYSMSTGCLIVQQNNNMVKDKQVIVYETSGRHTVPLSTCNYHWWRICNSSGYEFSCYRSNYATHSHSFLLTWTINMSIQSLVNIVVFSFV
jgi:hypothetical protein